MNLLIWASDPPAGHCTLEGGYIPEADDMHLGQSVAGQIAKDLSYRMSDRFPDDIELSDNFRIAGQIVVSGKLKQYLEGVLKDERIEYLPVSIINHKDRVASTDYFILNSLDLVDCIDLKASKVKWSPLDKTCVTSCKGLVFLPEALPARLRVFRPKHWGVNILIDEALAKDLVAQGFTGLHFFPAVGYNGIV